MFADSLCDSTWANRSHRGWTALAAFGLQALAVAGLLALPLLYNQALPRLQLMGPDLVAPAPPLQPPAPSPTHATRAPMSNVASDGNIVAPQSVPREIVQIQETSAPPPADVSGLGMRRGAGDSRALNGVMDSIGTAVYTAAPPPAAAHRPPVSVMMEGNLIRRVQPEYPPLAIKARIQGTVILHALISREGVIENLQVVSGHPMLAPAALAAVRQWRYRPYSLNGEPVEVETQVTVNFVLAGG